MPEGSIQLLMGSPAGLLDELQVQDHVAFTGSAHTAGLLRTHANVLHGGVTLGVEADSLNCSILGPDVTADDPELDLFVKGVVTEMTYKAGQKCTSIRRTLVPAPMVDTVIEALTARLARTTVGHPAAEGVRMGALVSLDQREEVRKAIQSLRASADVVYGDPDRAGNPDLIDADGERGAFLGPVLLRADASAVEPHDVEAFGPVSTVIGYDTVDDAIALAARGKGSLAGSLVTHDPEVARTVTLGVAPWHGRILVLDRDDAGESTGHGVPLPTLVHGGPGRAGGGEEMGGLRGVLHLMQRTALQGSPDMLTAITGRWTKGSARNDDGVHPFRKSLAELRIGDTIESAPRRVTLADIDHFAEFTGDTFYAHTDPEAAAKNPLFGGIVAHGYLVVSLAAGLFVDPDPGPVLANFGVDSLRFITPVKADDTIAVTLTVKQITPRTNADYGEVRWDAAGHERRRRAGGDLRRAHARRQGVALDVVALRARGQSSSPGAASSSSIQSAPSSKRSRSSPWRFLSLPLRPAPAPAPAPNRARPPGPATRGRPRSGCRCGRRCGRPCRRHLRGPRHPLDQQRLLGPRHPCHGPGPSRHRCARSSRCRARHWPRARRGCRRRPTGEPAVETARQAAGEPGRGRRRRAHHRPPRRHRRPRRCHRRRRRRG